LADASVFKDDWVTNMFSKGLKDLSSVYSSWCDASVVLLLAIHQFHVFHVPVPCSIIRESVAAARVRFNPGCEMDVRNELVLAVEESAIALEWIN
jgi:hypothetical protein